MYHKYRGRPTKEFKVVFRLEDKSYGWALMVGCGMGVAIYVVIALVAILFCVLEVV